MRFAGLKIKNYRSIGDTYVDLTSWKKCNILIGQNNAGKSNVIRIVEEVSKLELGANKSPHIDNVDRHQRNGNSAFECILSFELRFAENEFEQNLYQTLGLNRNDSKKIDFTLSEQIGTNGLLVTDNTFASIDSRKAYHVLPILVRKHFSHDRISQQEIRQGFVVENGINIFNTRFRSFLPQKVVVIPQFRQIQKGDKYQVDGKNLIAELAFLHHPPIGQDQKQKKFQQIQNLMRQLLLLPTATLEVSQEADPQIIINNNGLRLPLESWGTGVHELIILVTAILSIEDENTLICIEEPEIHLHPALQRRFIEFITTQTPYQYLISTHSPTLINTQALSIDAREQVQIFHLRSENGATIGGPVLTDAHALDVLNDLGVKASDILQANCVIWVEGPSDRIYLKRWIELIAPELQEGLHYTIMFYGGKLLAHLSVQHEETENELIKLLKINQRCAVIIDSDRKNPTTSINATKQRIQEECEQSQSFCWITDGREVENYLPERVMREIFKISTFQLDLFEEIEIKLKEVSTADSIPIKYNKVKHAHEFADIMLPEDIQGDLLKRVEALIEKIQEWNHLR